MRKLLEVILFSVLITIAMQAVTVYGYNCEQAVLTHHSFTGQNSSYTVTRRCTHNYNSSDKEIFDLTYSGTWEGATEVATEYVSNHVRYYEGGTQKNDQTYQYKVTSKCLQDPWLTNMDCYSHHVDDPYPECGGIVTTPPNPKGASVLPSSIRQSLQQEYYAQREAPTILAPSNSATFGSSEAIPMRVQHNPAYDLQFKIEWRPDAQHALQQISNSFITGEQSSNGITTARLHAVKEGEWTIRAQLDTNTSSWWSDPVTFTVKSATLGSPVNAEPEIISVPVNTSALIAPQFELPRVNHTYNAGEKIPLQINYQQGTVLRYQYGVRAIGSASFKLLPQVYAAQTANGFLDSEIPGVIGTLVDGDAAELLIKAWVERPDGGGASQYLAVTSEIAERVARIIVPKLQITAPKQLETMKAPALVHFVIPSNDYGMAFDQVPGTLLSDYFDVELEQARKIPGSAIAFAPYPREMTARSFGDQLLFSYVLTEPAIYRFRARFALSGEFGGSTNMGGQWTDWRQIELTSLQNQVKPIAGSAALGIHAAGDALSPKPDSQNKATLNARPVSGLTATKINPAADLDKTKAIGSLAAGNNTALRTMPTILRPALGQKIAAGTTVPLVIRGLDQGDDVSWELEYRPFGQNHFSRIPPNRLRLSGAQTALQTTGVIATDKEGEYRVRIRLNDGRQPWGRWHEFQVGTPAAVQSVQPLSKTEPVRATISRTPAPVKPTQTTQPVGSTLPTSSQARKPVMKSTPPLQMKTIKTKER